MNEYVIVAWLCLMLILGQVESQDQQETTINKKVARDIDIDQIPQESDFLSHLADVGNIVSNGVKSVIDLINAFAQQAKGLMQRFSTYGSR